MIDFLRFEYTQLIRSSYWHKNLLLNLFIVLSILYLVLNFLLIGFFLDEILMSIYPNQNPVFKLNGFLIYYFLLELSMRYFYQKIPVLSIQPYLVLPIKKSKLIHFMLLKSGLNYLNFVPLILFLPFALKIIYTYESTIGAFTWMLSLLLIGLSLNYFNLILKRVLQTNAILSIVYLFVLAIGIYGEYEEWWSLRPYSEWFFNQFAYFPITILFPLIVGTLLYFFNFKHLISKSYLENIQAYFPEQNKISGSFKSLSKFGLIGELTGLELKLIWRNKRPKYVMWTSFVFVLYGLLFYFGEGANSILLMAVMGLVMTGMFILNYGQFTHSWESAYFDFLLTSPIKTYQYYTSKFWLYAAMCGIAFVLSIPYVYYGLNVVLANTAMFLFNIGVNSFVVLYVTSFGPKPIDLKKGDVFNYKGTGASQFILALPIILIPLLVLSPFIIFKQEILGLFVIGILGLIGVLTHSFWIGQLSKNLQRKKHKISANFRELA